MKKVRAAGILCFRAQPSVAFLLMKLPDRWDLPKGHQEEGETDEQTALREFEEETGIPAAHVQLDPGFRWEVTYYPKSKREGYATVEKTVVFYLGRLDRVGELTLTEHDEAHWIDWNPPHDIQANTVNPLLQAAADYLTEGPFPQRK